MAGGFFVFRQIITGVETSSNVTSPDVLLSPQLSSQASIVDVEASVVFTAAGSARALVIAGVDALDGSGQVTGDALRDISVERFSGTAWLPVDSTITLIESTVFSKRAYLIEFDSLQSFTATNQLRLSFEHSFGAATTRLGFVMAGEMFSSESLVDEGFALQYLSTGASDRSESGQAFGQRGVSFRRASFTQSAIEADTLLGGLADRQELPLPTPQLSGAVTEQSGWLIATGAATVTYPAAVGGGVDLLLSYEARFDDPARSSFSFINSPTFGSLDFPGRRQRLASDEPSVSDLVFDFTVDTGREVRFRIDDLFRGVRSAGLEAVFSEAGVTEPVFLSIRPSDSLDRSRLSILGTLEVDSYRDVGGNRYSGGFSITEML